jgi:hypothetical protein
VRGVCALQEFALRLAAKQPELELTDSDLLVLEVAGAPRRPPATAGSAGSAGEAVGAQLPADSTPAGSLLPCRTAQLPQPLLHSESAAASPLCVGQGGQPALPVTLALFSPAFSVQVCVTTWAMGRSPTASKPSWCPSCCRPASAGAARSGPAPPPRLDLQLREQAASCVRRLTARMLSSRPACSGAAAAAVSCGCARRSRLALHVLRGPHREHEEQSCRLLDHICEQYAGVDLTPEEQQRVKDLMLGDREAARVGGWAPSSRLASVRMCACCGGYAQ